MKRRVSHQPHNQTLIEFLHESVRKFGERPALLFKPGFRYRQWTYAELWESAGQVAAMLQQHGIEKGDRVVLWAPNCPQWVIVFFGCVRAGAITVPLSAESPQDFVERVVSKTSPKLSFVSRNAYGVMEGMSVPEVHLEYLEETCEDFSSPHQVDVGPEDLVEIMFTSGTTGDPKGVMLTHRNLVSNTEATWHHVPADPSWRLVSFLPLSHMLEQTASLLTGIRSGASITYMTSLQPTTIRRTLKDRSPTILIVVPRFLDAYMSRIEGEIKRQGKQWTWKVAPRLPFWARRLMFRQIHKGFGGHLKLFATGGAALDPDLGRKWEMLGFRILQAYGTTEASPVVTAHTLQKPRYDSVGRPVPGVEVKISPEGEVFVRGDNITQGYWEDPEKTKASFQDGWYKTGDLGFIDEEGCLHLMGRKKDMLVLPSGENVYPEDVEMVLAKHPTVSEAVVVGMPKGQGVEVHAVLLTEIPDKAQEAVSWANSQMASHQRIRGFTVWPEKDLPKTHTYKVKKAVVLDRITGKTPLTETSVETTSKSNEDAPKGVESLMAQIAGLPIDRVTHERELETDLDMDSLKRAELLSAVEEELGVFLDESQIGPETTVGQLSEMVGTGPRTGTPMKLPRWGMRLWCRLTRGFIQRAIMFPLTSLVYRLRVTGREHLRDIQGPVLFAANHNLHMDSLLILKAMPSNIRRRLAIAATADAWRRRFWAIANPLVGNAVPFSKAGAVRASLDNVGSILDGGWSVLIYPEGDLTIGGPMLPFKNGPAMISVEGKVAVVPVRLHINRMGTPWQLPLMRRGNLEIRFGRPISFSPGTPYEEATQVIEKAVKTL
jgi:long-chain acyl-CoA synthetase